MAKLTDVYRSNEISYVNVGRRQIPVVAGDNNLMMIMDLNHKGLAIDSPQIRGKELEEFTRKFNLLSGDELRQSLEIDSATFVSVLNQCVQCVGCRRRVERLFYQLTLSGHPTLDPLVLKTSCTLSITEEKLKTPQALGTLLYRHHEVLNNLLENKLRNKTRCVLHSLDAFRSKPFSETWREVWSSMKHNCREELSVIETKELHEVLENYLMKHKFCQGCRTKIEKAYKILVGEATSKEKGFVAALYANIKKCHPDKHIHVFMSKIDFLIRRAEPEVNGSYSKQRERHAKTLEIAQEEVLTCVGLIMYDRLRRIYVSLREEERACQLLAAVGVHALCRSFDTCVEKKQGISNLELLYQEISRAEKAKEHKREQKKLKKKKKKNEKKSGYRTCENSGGDGADAGSDTAEADEEEDDDDEEEDHDEAVDVGADDDVDEADIEEEEETTSLAEETEAESAIEARRKIEEQSPLQQQQQQPPQKKKKLQKQKQKQKPPQKKNKKKQPQPQVANRSTPTPVVATAAKCNDCLAPTANCPCESDVRDSGYGSEPNSHGNSRTSSVVSSPEGSVVCCSDGCCSNEHDSAHAHDELEDGHCANEACDSLLCQQRMHTLSLQQMLDDFDGSDEDEENCYIPQEVVLEYQYQREKVQQQRQQLRETLRQNFARLCMKRGATPSQL